MEQGAYKLQDKNGGGNEISDQIRTLMDQIDKPSAFGTNPSTGSFS